MNISFNEGDIYNKVEVMLFTSFKKRGVAAIERPR